MVNKGQAFTLEGVAASLLLLVTTYAVFQSSVAITPSWGELEEVQLKLLGYDLLRCVDDELSDAISAINKTTDCSSPPDLCNLSSPIGTNFSRKLNATLGDLDLNCRLEVLWTNKSNNVTVLETTLIEPFDSQSPKDSIIVDRIIIVDNPDPNSPFCSSKCAVEVRMVLWRI